MMKKQSTLFPENEVTVIAELDLKEAERLARLIKMCGFLLQTKVYLFWENLNV